MAQQPSKSNKSRPYRALAIFVVITGLVGLGVFGWRVLRGIQMPEAPLANAPRSASIIGYARVANVLQSSILRLILRREVLQDRVERIRERCGFDPASQLEDVIVFFEGNQIRNRESGLGIIGRGPFDHDKLSRCFREAFAEEGLGEMRRIEIDDVPAAAPANSDQRAAFLGKRGIAIGNEQTIRHVIHTVRDAQPSAAQDPVLARIWERTAGGRDIVLVGKMPQDWQQALRDLAGVGPDAQYRGMIEQVTAFGIGADVTNGLRLGGVLAMRDEAAANALATSTRQQLDGLAENLFVSITPFGPVLRSIRTEKNGQDFVITMDLPQERLDRLIEFSQSFLQQLDPSRAAAGANGQAVPGQPGQPMPTIRVVPSPAPADPAAAPTPAPAPATP